MSSIPAMAAAAFLNCLKRRMTATLDLMFRWSCSIRSFKDLDDRSFVFSAIRRRPSCTHRPMRRRVAIERDGLRRAALTLDRLLEEGLGRSDIATGTQPEVHRLTGPIHGPVEIHPSAAKLHIRLVDAP